MLSVRTGRASSRQAGERSPRCERGFGKLCHMGKIPALARGARPQTRSSITLLCPETGSKLAPSGFLAYLYRLQVFKYLLRAFIGVRARFIFNVPVFMDSCACIFLA